MTENWNCFTVDLIILNVALASIDGFLAIIAFAQHYRMPAPQDSYTKSTKWLDTPKGTPSHGWHFQLRVLHLFCNYCFCYLSWVALLVWYMWFYSYGLPQSSVFGGISPPALVLANEEEEEEEEEDNAENRTQQALLEDIKRENGSAPMKDHWRCCSINAIHIGSRQKYAVMVVVLIFVVMVSFDMLIWITDDKNLILRSVVARVYETFLAVMILILAGALGCYGFLLFFRLRQVRFEKASSEMWKVVSLAIICVICFSSSALVALNTDIPLFYHWHLKIIYGVKALVFLILYYFIGSSLPSAYLLWIIRELPPPVSESKQEQQRSITFISQGSSGSNEPLLWTIVSSSKNQMSRASPI